MVTATGRRPFSTLGDQQLLDQTKRLAANQRSLEVHILDHLDEIDRRNLALRRGFSSLFDYAVRELRFSDAAAQRRIQTMRLCRRHGWVRALLYSGELSVTATAQMETAFAAAERACRRAIADVGQEQCHDRPGLPASGSAAGNRDGDESGAGAGMARAAAMTGSAAHGVVVAGREAWSPRDAGRREGRGAGSDRRRPSSNEPAAVAGRPAAAGAQLPVGRLPSSAAAAGATPASTPERVQDRPDSNTAAAHASPLAEPGRAARTGLADGEAATTPVVPVASHADAPHRGAGYGDAVSAGLQSNGGAAPSPAPSHASGSAALSSELGPVAPLLPATSHTVPVVAAVEPPPTAAPAPEPSRSNPTGELPARPVTAAALLHPQRQRELIEQAAGMTTRQVAGLLATAAAQVVPPRDTLRAVAPDRYTLKVSIDQECEQGLRQLKNLRSHLDPRMSWGDLVARLVREAVARHDPRGGGRRPGRADSAAASTRRGRSRTAAVVPPVARAAGGGDTPSPQGGRVPRPTRRAPDRLRRGVEPAEPVEQPEQRNQASGAPCLTASAAPSGAPQSTGCGAADGSDATAVLPVTPPAPQLADVRAADGTEPVPIPPGVPPAPQFARGGTKHGSDAAPIQPGVPPAPQFAGGDTEDGTRAAPAPLATPPAPELAGGVPAAHGEGGRPAGSAPRFTRDAPRGPRRSPLRRPIPAAVRRHVWLRDGGRCCYRDPLTGRRCNSSHLLQIDHLLPVAEGGGPEPHNLALACFAHHRLRHGWGPALPWEPSR